MMTVSELIEELRQLDPLAPVYLPRSLAGGEVARCGRDTLIEWEDTHDEQGSRLLPKGLPPHPRDRFEARAERSGVVLFTEEGFAEARLGLERRAAAS